MELTPAVDPESSGQEVQPGLEGDPGSPQSLCRAVTLQASFTNTAALEKAEDHLEVDISLQGQRWKRTVEVRVGRKHFWGPEVRPGSGWGGDGCAMVWMC